MKNSLIHRDDSGFGGSRDFWMESIECKCTTCHCNDGKGKCVVPSKISIGPDARCRTGYSQILDEKK